MQLRKLLAECHENAPRGPLQWGRNFAVAETFAFGRPFRRAGPASMGPQLCSCGNNRTSVYVWRMPRASMGPQLCSCGNIVGASRIVGRNGLQWGRNFAVAETGCRVYFYRNGAEASMGPQLCSCGNQVLRQPLLHAPKGFNGAATLQLRKRPVMIRVEGRNACFNGAATLQLRKRIKSQIGSCGLTPLQWGRNFAVAETRRARRHQSMRARFNGAATLQLRKRKAWA